jgi:aspartyl-tRNA(Asn)/glutamyl-tRNA(Gln) amidotransferase subunit C
LEENPLFITVQKVDYLANLAKLKLSREERKRYQRELDKIIGYIDQLEGLETTHVSPNSHVIALESVMRCDKVFPSLLQNQSLANAPRRKDGFLRVRKVIG